METFLQEHPEYSRGLLTFAVEYLVANSWNGNKLMRDYDYNSCDSTCTRGAESCGCTCDIDIEQWPDDQVSIETWYRITM